MRISWLIRGQSGRKKGLGCSADINIRHLRRQKSYDQRVKESDSAFGFGGLAASV